MNGTVEVWLAIIALALVVMAAIQVGAIVAGLRVARRVDRLTTELDANLKPLIANLTTMSAEASRAASMAAAQVERVDRLFSELVRRVDQTLSVAQQFVSGPARDGMAIVTGIKAAITALRSLRENTRRRSAQRSVRFEEDEESLFIG